MRHLIQPLRHLAAVIVVVLDSPPDSIAGLSFQNVSKVPMLPDGAIRQLQPPSAGHLQVLAGNLYGVEYK